VCKRRRGAVLGMGKALAEDSYGGAEMVWGCMLREGSSNFLEDRLPPRSRPSPIKPSHLHLHSPRIAIPPAHANAVSSADTQYIKRRVRGDVEALSGPRGCSYRRGREGRGGRTM
jgi:hypothetical protein